MTRDELTLTLSEYAGAAPEEQASIAEKILAENDRIITESEQRQSDLETATEQYRELRKKYVQGMINAPGDPTEPKEPEEPKTPERVTFDSLFAPLNN